MDTFAAAVIGACDGSLSAGRALTAVCALLDEEPATHRSGLVRLMRTLVADGMLVPADPRTPLAL